MLVTSHGSTRRREAHESSCFERFVLEVVCLSKLSIKTREKFVEAGGNSSEQTFRKARRGLVSVCLFPAAAAAAPERAAKKKQLETNARRAGDWAYRC